MDRRSFLKTITTVLTGALTVACAGVGAGVPRPAGLSEKRIFRVSHTICPPPTPSLIPEAGWSEEPVELWNLAPYQWTSRRQLSPDGEMFWSPPELNEMLQVQPYPSEM